MDSFNLIPNEYRQAQVKRRTAIKLVILCSALLALTSMSLSFAERMVQADEQEADELRMKKAVSTREQARMTELTKQKKALEGQALLLSSLRSGAPVTELIQTIDKAAFAGVEQLEPGMAFEAQGPEGQVQRIIIKKVDGDEVTIDGNHPLAGVTLNFAVEIIAVREATQEEIEHGHVH